MYKVSKRSERVASVIKRQLTTFLRQKMSDSMLRKLSITCVDISPDLRNAKIFIMPPFGVDNSDELVVRLTKNASYIRREMAQSSELRFIPKLSFHIDSFLIKANKLTDLLNKHAIPESES